MKPEAWFLVPISTQDLKEPPTLQEALGFPSLKWGSSGPADL